MTVSRCQRCRWSQPLAAGAVQCRWEPRQPEPMATPPWCPSVRTVADDSRSRTIYASEDYGKCAVFKPAKPQRPR